MFVLCCGAAGKADSGLYRGLNDRKGWDDCRMDGVAWSMVGLVAKSVKIAMCRMRQAMERLSLL